MDKKQGRPKKRVPTITKIVGDFRYLTPKNVETVLGISKGTVYNMIQDGRLETKVFGAEEGRSGIRLIKVKR